MQYSGSGYHQQAPPDQAYGGYGYNSRAPAYYSIDVECVAVGPTHIDRAVAQVALVVRSLLNQLTMLLLALPCQRRQ